MSQAKVLIDLKDKRRRKYWEFKDTYEHDWRKRLFEHELVCLNSSIEYLSQIPVTKSLKVIASA